MASILAIGLQEIAPEPLCPLTKQKWIIKKYLTDFSLSLMRRGLYILLSSLSSDTPVKGWWSDTTIMLGQSMINMRHLSNAQAIAAASPSIGAYRSTGSVQNQGLGMGRMELMSLSLVFCYFFFSPWQLFCPKGRCFGRRNVMKNRLSLFATVAIKHIGIGFWDQTLHV